MNLTREQVKEWLNGSGPPLTPTVGATMQLLATQLLATMDALEAERDRLAAYIGARDFDGGCICDSCVDAITKRLECADELLAAAREAGGKR